MLIVAHRRLDKVREVVDAVVSAGTADVTVVIDGPRNSSEVVQVDAVEDFLLEVEWPGEWLVSRREVNLGVGGSVPDACDSFFARVSAGIVLEDDCVPTREFIEFASMALEQYRDDSRVGVISGVCLASTASKSLFAGAPAALSRYPLTWGWATWADRWQHYRRSLRGWRQELPLRRLAGLVGVKAMYDWKRLFDAHAVASPPAWDYQLAYMLWRRDQWSVNPSIDLVRNIGFDADASNTSSTPPYAPRVPVAEARQSWLKGLEATMANGPLIVPAPAYDRWLARSIFSPPVHVRASSLMRRRTAVLRSRPQ